MCPSNELPIDFQMCVINIKSKSNSNKPNPWRQVASLSRYINKYDRSIARWIVRVEEPPVAGYAIMAHAINIWILIKPQALCVAL